MNTPTTLSRAQVHSLIWSQGLKLAQWARRAYPCAAPEPQQTHRNSELEFGE